MWVLRRPRAGLDRNRETVVRHRELLGLSYVRKELRRCDPKGSPRQRRIFRRRGLRRAEASGELPGSTGMRRTRISTPPGSALTPKGRHGTPKNKSGTPRGSSPNGNMRAWAASERTHAFVRRRVARPFRSSSRLLSGFVLGGGLGHRTVRRGGRPRRPDWKEGADAGRRSGKASSPSAKAGSRNANAGNCIGNGANRGASGRNWSGTVRHYMTNPYPISEAEVSPEGSGTTCRPPALVSPHWPCEDFSLPFSSRPRRRTK